MDTENAALGACGVLPTRYTAVLEAPKAPGSNQCPDDANLARQENSATKPKNSSLKTQM
jgi:hypothetical protein